MYSGFRLDHQFTANDTVFARFNRSNQNQGSPLNFNVSTQVIHNYAQVAALGYTHSFNSKNHPELSLRIHLAEQLCERWTIGSGFGDGHGLDCANSPVHDGEVFAPNLGLGNGYNGIRICHTARSAAEHGLSLRSFQGDGQSHAGRRRMYYHIRSFDDGWGISASFSAAGTAQNGLTANNTGFTPASLHTRHTSTRYAPWVGAPRRIKP